MRMYSEDELDDIFSNMLDQWEDTVVSDCMLHGELIDVCKGCGGELDIEGDYCSYCLFGNAE